MLFLFLNWTPPPPPSALREREGGSKLDCFRIDLFIHTDGNESRTAAATEKAPPPSSSFQCKLSLSLSLSRISFPTHTKGRRRGKAPFFHAERRGEKRSDLRRLERERSTNENGEGRGFFSRLKRSRREGGIRDFLLLLSGYRGKLEEGKRNFHDIVPFSYFEKDFFSEVRQKGNRRILTSV